MYSFVLVTNALYALQSGKIKHNDTNHIMTVATMTKLKLHVKVTKGQ